MTVSSHRIVFSFGVLVVAVAALQAAEQTGQEAQRASENEWWMQTTMQAFRFQRREVFNYGCWRKILTKPSQSSKSQNAASDIAIDVAFFGI